MELTTTLHGKPFYSGVELNSLFSANYFHDVTENTNEDRQVALHTNLGSLTVLDRMTGFGWRDIETGYRDATGAFWLASGGFDVRQSGAQTMQEAIEWIKTNANTCNPSRREQP